jgi:ribulose-5-phosphate 4-epimerase/fuculose-1-phosphate aldolase
MDLSGELLRLKPAGMADTEWQLRLELAALYRLFDYLGWTEMIYNHITVRVPGPDKHYLINPYGLNYDEVTASNLVKVGLDGVAVDGSKHMVNVAGFVIHSAIHAARDDAHCVIHTHTTAGMGIACKQEGFRFDNFYSAQLYGLLAFHDFEGITTDVAEQERLVKSLGDKPVMILRNHGLLVIGPHVPHALSQYWTVQRACEVQMAADSFAGANVPVGRKVLDAIPEQARFFRTGAGGGPRRGQLFFDALMRKAKLRYEELV